MTKHPLGLIAPQQRRTTRRRRTRANLLLSSLACALAFCLLSAAPSAVRAQSAASADLVVTKSGDDSAPVGGQITYSVVVTNAGPDASANVVLADAIPAHTTFVSDSTTQGTATSDGTTVTANFGNIAAFESASLTLVVSVNGDTPRGTTITNTATATSDTPDPDPGSNSATASTAVFGPFAGDVLISEFRFRGPGTPDAQGEDSALDEFVELYNNTDSDILVSGQSGGWALVSSDAAATPKFVVPNGTRIPARGHLLATGSGYSLGAYPADGTNTATGDVTYDTDIPDDAGIALFRTADPSGFVMANRLDAVGFSAPTPATVRVAAVADPLFTEGGGLAVAPVTVGAEHSFLRRLESGRPQDTDNNAADFVLVATDGNQTLQSARLGAPGPENTFSPPQHNDLVRASLIEPTLPSDQTPNRERAGSGDSGTLSIRRRFTNLTGTTITRLRFRVVDITTLGSPAVAAPQADVRLTDSDDLPITTSRGALTVKGTVLEEPPAHPLDGGLNASAVVQLPGGVLADGDTLDVQFVLKVAHAGRFRFYVNVEPVLAPPEEGSAPLKSKTKAPAGSKSVKSLPPK
ncbi:MAG: hypothetical protein ABR563_18795 [Pyrinomonadaceae bacterium]